MNTKEIGKIKEEIENYKVSNEKQLEEFRQKFIGKKSIIKNLFNDLKTIDAEIKKSMGLTLNALKDTATEKFKELIAHLEAIKKEKKSKISQDITLLPSNKQSIGSMHPISIVEKKMINILSKLGFCLSKGPEIEDDWHNFTALNFGAHHPARDMQDTFFIKNSNNMLRTHTSSVQIRVMEKNEPPIKTIAIGRVFRNEAISARSHSMFNQIEAMHINKNVSIIDLKQTLQYFVNSLFNKKIEIRFRPSFFPFTTPSIEVDINCQICETGCNICKYTGWVELGGAGMIDPNVLSNCNIDHKKYSGFAFGMGLERITMLKYKINDLRIFTENDMRFLNQFIHAN